MNMDRKCPHCGEFVSGNSLNCPSCFKDIPRSIEKSEERDEPVYREGGKSRTFAIVLALLFGAFGFMGLGHIYIGDHKRGALFLVLSLPLMIILVLLLSNAGDLSLGGAILTVGALLLFGIIYAGLYVVHAISIMIVA